MNTLTVHALSTFTRVGRGGFPVHVVSEGQPLSAGARQRLARELGTLTAYVSAETLDPTPAVFYDPDGPLELGENALIAIFRALALTGRTVARRVMVETALGLFPVQEEVFRKPSQAQVWIELPLPEPVLPVERPQGVLEPLGLAEANGAWRSGALLLVEGPSLEQVRAWSLELSALQRSLPAGIRELLLYSRRSSSPFSDLFVRHFSTRGHGRELAASVGANAALGIHLWQSGLQKTYLLLEQGEDLGQPCRISVWIEADNGPVSRVSVGGQVTETLRTPHSHPEES